MNLCRKSNDLCKYANSFGYCTAVTIVCNKHIDELSQINSLNDDDTLEIATTPEFFAKIKKEEINAEKATNFLKKLGIQVKTDYGNYRPTYDVLVDIGDFISRI